MQTHSLAYDAEAKKWSSRFPAGDSPRTLVTAFGAPELADCPELFVEIARAYPRSLVVGCSTAGEIHGTAVRDRSLAVTVTHFDRTDLQLASASVSSMADSEAAGAELGRKLSAKPGLRAVFVLGDGSAVNGSDLVRGLTGTVDSGVIVTGGLAADAAPERTWLTIGGTIKHKIVCAVGFYGASLVVGHGISSDWVSQPREWVITRCDGNRIYEFDNCPALEAYRAGLGDRADELPEVSIWYPLLTKIAGQTSVVRAVIGIDEAAGALVLAGDVTVGQQAALLSADVGDLIDGGGRAASMATKTGGAVSVDCLALTVSCVHRRKILGDWSAEEVQSMREGLHAQRAAVTGFYAQAQLSPDATGPSHLHNQTLTLTVFSEARPADAPQRTPRPAMRAIPTGYAVRVARYDPRSASWSPQLPELDSTRTLVLAFGAPEIADDRSAIDGLRTHFGNSVVIGCSTAGEICGSELHDHSLTVAAIKFLKTDLRLVVEKLETTEESAEVGRRLAEALMAERKLRGILLLGDGLVTRGSELIRGINAVVGGSVPVVGGLAADGTAFARTWVLAGDTLDSRTVAAVGFYGNHVVIGHGARGGWDRFGVKRTITRSSGNVLYELDGRPALQIYREYLGDRAMLPSAGLSLPLAIREPSLETPVVRTILGIDDAAGSVTFAGDVPAGSITQFMKADFERLVNGATHAALLASENGPPASAECLALAIACAGRRYVLGAHAEEEVEAIVESFHSDRVRLAGFYGYGQLSPRNDGLCEIHNQAMTIALISESITAIPRPTVPPKLSRSSEFKPPVAAPTARRPTTAPPPPTTTPPPSPTTPPPPSTTPPPRRKESRPPPSPPGEVTATLESGQLLSGSLQSLARGAIVRIPRPHVGEATIEETGAGDPRVLRLGGRITEAFKGDVAAQLLRGRVILDLGDVQRITSFGVREWLAMFAGAVHLQDCYFARCSESIVNQLTLIRKFDGGSHILSFFAPYLCTACNKPFERLFDRDFDADEIARAAPESVRCPRCDGSGNFDDDPRSYFAFFATHDRVPVPADVRSLHDALCTKDQVRPAEDLEKVIEGDTTRIRVNGKLALGIRWRRVFENIEGAIIVDLSAVTSVEANGIQSLDLALRTVMVRNAVTIEHAPLPLIQRLVQRPAPKIVVASVVVNGYCRTCTVARTTAVQVDAYAVAPNREPEARCRRCDTRLELQIDSTLKDYVTSITATPTDPVATEPTDDHSDPLTQRWHAASGGRRAATVKYVAVAGVIGAAALALAIGPLSRHHTTTTTIVEQSGDAAEWNRLDDVPPPWVDYPFMLDGDLAYVVGQADGVSVTEAIASARVHATEQLIWQLYQDLVPGPTRELVKQRVVRTPSGITAAIKKFQSQHSKTVRLERTEVASRAESRGTHVAVRFKLARAIYDQVLAGYDDTATASGVTVAVEFPLLAEPLGAAENLVVVAVAKESPASTAGIEIGDLVVAVNGIPVSSLAEFLALASQEHLTELVLSLSRARQPVRASIDLASRTGKPDSASQLSAETVGETGSPKRRRNKQKP